MYPWRILCVDAHCGLTWTWSILCFGVGGKKQRSSQNSDFYMTFWKRRNNLTTPFQIMRIDGFEFISCYLSSIAILNHIPSFLPSMMKSILLTLTILSTQVTPNYALSTPTPHTQPPPSSNVKRLLQNLQSISTHLQNPELYSTSWANQVSLVSLVSSSNVKRKSRTTGNENDDYGLIASKDVKRGELVTLYPVHAIGIKPNENDTNEHGKSDPKGVGMGMGATTTKIPSLELKCS